MTMAASKVTGLMRTRSVFSRICMNTLQRIHGVRYFHAYEGTARCPYPMTRDEAYSIAETFLSIERPQVLFKQDPEELLNRVAERMKKVVSFSTAPMFALPGHINDEVGKEIMLKAKVGGCYSINPMTKAILDNIGYRTIEVLARSPEVEYDHHMGNIICDVYTYPDSQHFIEPGSRLLLNRAIPLDFERESCIYKIHSMTCKFFKRDGNLLWCRRIEKDNTVKLHPDKLIQDENGEQWQTMLIYWMEKPNARHYMNQYMNELVTGLTVAPDNVMSFLFAGCLHNEFINIWTDGETVIRHTFYEDGVVKKSEITLEEMTKFFNENFSSFAQLLLPRVIKANFHFAVPRTTK